ncbi:2ac167d8-8931-4f6a-8aec-4950fc29b9a8 [Thermothielavioides terrestris]|uniref:2ac167d8-8931-4f6a-8aec-4950fc29b9a8 n=1 Tax=Thermothielavioides terrestris TaxID=2587410 RepID=A0A3S4ANW0_9PEZI|nr:2ac167d8-8931-4f6a-8aec-4950fc29b9a8 [Thermothielavioides terrestris]
MADLEIVHDPPSAPPSPENPDGVPADDVPVEIGAGPQSKKRRPQRLLRGLQQMSSFPSLKRPGRPRSASSPYSISGALSCISLTSTASPFGQPSASSYFSQPSAAAGSSAHTSIPGSPIAESPSIEGEDSALAVRTVDCTPAMSNTVSLPAKVKKKQKSGNFSLWASLPHELRVYVLSFLRPKELVRASAVSKEFYEMCFDGQLWTSLDASEFYREIPAEALAKIIASAGPFVKDLNLRGCVQVEHYKRAEVVVKACRNLINATLEGCRNFQRSTLHELLKANSKLARLNLTGLAAVNNATCKIVANSCPQLEVFNVSWCKDMDARGVKFVVEACPRLKDLRAGEIAGFNNKAVAEAIFRTNKLERLVLAGCDDLTDAALQIMIHGPNPEIDYATGRPMAPPRKLRHLDLSRCSQLTSDGVESLGYLVPDLEGLQLSGVTRLTDAALEPILASTPRLTHLELEDLAQLTNNLFSEHLAKAPCAAGLEHLGISYCENIGDEGMLPVIQKCTRLRSVYMDNTLVSDLVLAEAAAMVRKRSASAPRRPSPTPLRPTIGLNLVVYDCVRVTWTGVREVLSRNAEAVSPPGKDDGKGKDKGKGKMAVVEHHSHSHHPSSSSSLSSSSPSSSSTSSSSSSSSPAAVNAAPAEIIGLKCFYEWQMTVDEHTKRVLRGDAAAACRLERKWADYMQANEEAGVRGAGGRRRRRRAREAQQLHGLEEAVGAAGS